MKSIIFVALCSAIAFIGCSQSAHSLSENPQRKNAQVVILNDESDYTRIRKTYDCDSDLLVLLSARTNITVVKRDDLSEKGKMDFRLHCPL